jgi:hypothetical protein
VTRQRFEASHHIDANDRRVSSQRSVCDGAQSRAPVTTLQFLQLCGSALDLNQSLLGRHYRCAGRDIGT